MITEEKKIFIARTTALLLLSIITTTLGGIIYILFRPTDPIFFEWIKTVGLSHELTKLRDLEFLLKNRIPEWIIYSLPNGLWAFSYAALITHIWWRSPSILKFFWMTTIPALILGYEFLQLTEILRGTFCWYDLTFGVAGIISGMGFGIITSK